jgi:hypothetical protein
MTMVAFFLPGSIQMGHWDSTNGKAINDNGDHGFAPLEQKSSWCFCSIRRMISCLLINCESTLVASIILVDLTHHHGSKEECSGKSSK